MEKLISVIVPVYNVEPYLENCLDSIAAQTYRNLEIILVDDGSTDSSGTICDRYALLDGRIKVLHTENAGLSAARNNGMAMAAGAYLGFVDGDDWIEPDMFEQLTNAIQMYDADIAECGIIVSKKGKHRSSVIQEDLVWSTDDALYELIRQKTVKTNVSNKLYRKELWDGFSFTVGRVNEDILLVYKVFNRANKIVRIKKNLYHYMRRDDSLIGTFPLPVRVQNIRAKQERADDLRDIHPELTKILCVMLCKGYIELKCKAMKTDPAIIREQMTWFKTELNPFWRRWRKEIQKHAKISNRSLYALDLFMKTPIMYYRLFHLKKSIMEFFG